MLQTKVTMGGAATTSYIMYDWVAPYVGVVANIQSLDDETQELFTTASGYFWLKALNVP